MTEESPIRVAHVAPRDAGDDGPPRGQRNGRRRLRAGVRFERRTWDAIDQAAGSGPSRWRSDPSRSRPSSGTPR